MAIMYCFGEELFLGLGLCMDVALHHWGRNSPLIESLCPDPRGHSDTGGN